jgi:hypothetical protein
VAGMQGNSFGVRENAGVPKSSPILRDFEQILTGYEVIFEIIYCML